MKRKFFLGAFLSILVSTLSFAQSNFGVEYFFVKDYDEAKKIFENQLQNNESVAEAYYYLGEIAFAKGDLSTAKANFEKGLAADPNNALNSVGLGKLILKSDKKTADDMFSAAIKKNKKDPAVAVAAAYAYFDNGMFDDARKKAGDARKAKKDYPYSYVCEGDVYFVEKDVNKAISQYAQAMHFAKGNPVGYIKSAMLYESSGTGRPTAIDDLNRAIEASPNFLTTYKILGNLYYLSGNYPKTIETYSAFLQQGGVLDAKERADLSGAYYFTKQYDGAEDVLKVGLATNPNDFFMNRVLMYTYADTQDYEKAVEVGDKFFSLELPKNAKYLFNDYMKYGTSLGKLKKGKEAVALFNKALELESANPDWDNHALYKELARASSDAGEPGEGALFLKKYIDAAGDKVETKDYFDMGVYYYVAGQPKVAQLVKAQRDSTFQVDKASYDEGVVELGLAQDAFSKVIELDPVNVVGYVFRARTASALDPSSEKGLAQPYYIALEEAILKSNSEDPDPSGEMKNKAELIEAYNYLCYFSYLQYEKNKTNENKALIKQYSEKLIVIDPNNTTASQLLEYIK